MSKQELSANHGEHLYYKNIAHNVLRQSKIEETRKNEEDNFTMEFNFQPHFLKTETSDYSNVKSRFYRESIPISKYVDENTTFQPNKNTKVLEIKGEEDINRMTNRLYSEQKKFKENKEKLAKNYIKEQYPFMPTINVPGKADPKYFMMRLEKWNKKIEEKNKENIEKKNNLGANHGKSKMFQPVVKDPIAKKMKRENEVHIDLYNKGLEHLNYRKSIMTTDTREDLAQIENEKKERIKNLKEERERFKKEKQEKTEKEINERTLKAKIEKENLDKIIKERTEKIFNEIDKKEKKAAEMLEKKNAMKQKLKTEENRAIKNVNEENKNLKQKNINPNLNKNENDKKEKIQLKSNPKKEEKKALKVSQKEKENTDIKKPQSSKQKTNPKMEKSPNKKVEEITKNEKVINKNKNEEQPLKKIEKKERNRSQPAKSKKKPDFVKKEKETKTITVSKEEKESNLVKVKKVENKEDNNYANKLKSAKNNIKNLLNNKNEIIGELEFNNMKSNKKPNINHKNTNEYNVVSVGSKTGKIKKSKK